MLEHLLRRPVSVWIAALGLVVLGAFSLWRLPLSLLPTLERPRLVVSMVDEDRSRAELLHDLVIPLERRLQTLEGVLDVFSSVGDGEAVVSLQTEWQTDVDRLRIEAERRLVEVSSASLDELVVEVEAGDTQPILQIAITGGTAHQRTAFAERVLVPELGRLPGAGEIEVFGTAHLRTVVEPRAADLAARGVSALDIADALEPVGQNIPLGRLRDGALLRPLVVHREIADVRELGDLLVSTGGVKLKEVADIRRQEVPDRGLFRRHGQSGILVDIYRAPGANAVFLAREGRAALERLARRSSSLQVELVADRSREVVASLTRLAEAGFLGLLLGTAILRFMLGSWRPTFALAVVVPVSIVAAFSGFYLFGISLDIVSLAGLALAAGMLVDNSIVVLEAISSSAEQGSRKPVLEGTSQIAMPLVAGFLTTAVVFLPLIYLRGLARAFFGVQAFAIISTLVVSLALSLTLTPVMARRFSGASLSGSLDGPKGHSPGKHAYESLLNRMLQHPGWAATGLLGGLAIAVVAALPSMRTELIPQGVAGAVGVDVSLPASLGLEEAERRLMGLEQKLLEEVSGLDNLEVVYRGDAKGRFPLASRKPDATMELRFNEAAASGLTEVEAAVAATPGLVAGAKNRVGSVSSVVETATSGIEIELSAGVPERLEPLARKVREKLEEQGISVTESRSRHRSTGGNAVEAPNWVLTWDPVQTASLKVDEETLSRQVAAGLGGFTRGRMAIQGNEPEIWVEPIQSSVFAQMPLKVPDLGWVPLSALARFEQEWSLPPLERRNGRPSLHLTADRGLASAEQIEAAVNTLSWGADEGVSLSGQVREARRSFDQLRLALLLALILVFLTVAAIYESLTMPLVVMMTVPVAAGGGLLALMVTGQSLNVMSFLGLILLSGIVVNNAIVLVHRAEQLRAGSEWSDAATAVRLAAAERYRPILMTTLTTLLGMIPLALLGGEGLELRRALATTVIGGLVTSWAAALLIVPALYLAWGRWKVAHRG